MQNNENNCGARLGKGERGKTCEGGVRGFLHIYIYIYIYRRCVGLVASILAYCILEAKDEDKLRSCC
jgi:hypothetical protein